MKIIMVIFLLLASIAFIPSGVSANHGWDTLDLQHAYKPHAVTDVPGQIGWTNARVNNITNANVNSLVCVEAWGTPSSKTHLGCLKVNLDPTMSSGNWAQEFNAPTAWLNRGTYRLAYTYQDNNGAWQEWNPVKPPATVTQHVAPAKVHQGGTSYQPQKTTWQHNTMQGQHQYKHQPAAQQSYSNHYNHYWGNQSMWDPIVIVH